MKRLYRSCLSILLVFMLLIASTAPALAATATPRYVSLGDSIATGTTTPLTASTRPYTDQFYAYLKTKMPKMVRSEFETDGDRTNDLLSKLTTNRTMISAVKSATVITVCIGGNNLMQACKTWYGYDFFSPNTTIADKGYNDFVNQWPVIAQRIRSLNSKATVIVMNLYNPFHYDSPTTTASAEDNRMHAFVNSYYFTSDKGVGMNKIIEDNKGIGKYMVVDAYKAFDESYTIKHTDMTLMYPASLLRNPHPTQAGQNMLFTLHQALYP